MVADVGPGVTSVRRGNQRGADHRLELNDINRGFDLMHAGESIRSVVVY